MHTAKTEKSLVTSVKEPTPPFVVDSREGGRITCFCLIAHADQTRQEKRLHWMRVVGDEENVARRTCS